MKVKDFLKSSNWCRGCNAEDQYGVPVPANSNRAVKFCLLGAIIRCYPLDERNEIVDKLLSHTKNVSCVMSYNDCSPSFTRIKKLIEKANV